MRISSVGADIIRPHSSCLHVIAGLTRGRSSVFRSRCYATSPTGGNISVGADIIRPLFNSLGAASLRA